MRMLRLFLALVFVVFWGSLAWAAEPDAGFEKEIKGFVLKYREAFKEKDIDAVMAMYADDAVLMGTGPGERFVGKEEIKNAYIEYFKTFDKEEYTMTWSKVGKQGDVVWATGMTQFTSYYKNKKNEFALNWTTVLVKQDGAWKIVHRHISNLSCE